MRELMIFLALLSNAVGDRLILHCFIPSIAVDDGIPFYKSYAFSVNVSHCPGAVQVRCDFPQESDVMDFEPLEKVVDGVASFVIPQQILYLIAERSPLLHLQVLNSTAGVIEEGDVALDVVGYPISRYCTIISSFSVVMCVMVMVMYTVFPSLSKWPSNIVFWRTCVDLVYSVQSLVLSSYLSTNGAHEVDGLCHPALAFITQFSIMASLNWYFILAVNLYYSIKNPFVLPQSRQFVFHLYAWGTAALTGLVVAFNYSYRPEFQLCWVKYTQGINVLNWIVLFIWLFFYAGIAMIVLAWTWLKLSQAKTKELLERRQASLTQTKWLTFCFSIQTVVGAISWYLIYKQAAIGSQLFESQTLAYIFATISSSLGVVNAVVWLVLQRKHFNFRRPYADCHTLCYRKPRSASGGMRAAMLEKQGSKFASQSSFRDAPPPPPDLSEALRKDFLSHFTTSILKCLPPGNDPVDENAKEGYKFQVWHKETFSKLRDRFGVKDEVYLESVGAPVETGNVSEGASGCFFFETTDSKYRCKTLSSEEKKVLEDILEAYFDYFTLNPHSRLCRFFGLYSVTMHGHTAHVAVMNNFLYHELQDEKPDEVYDLKGSRINRHGKGNVYKDNDLKRPLLLGDWAVALREQLTKDSEFLSTNGIMDYSLILGVHYCNESRKETHCNQLNHPRTRDVKPVPHPQALTVHASDSENVVEGGILLTAQRSPILLPQESRALLGGEDEAVELSPAELDRYSAAHIVGPGLYYVGIIDILQKYTWGKKSERFGKVCGLCHCRDAADLSVQPPDVYHERFAHMMHEIMLDRLGSRMARHSRPPGINSVSRFLNSP